MKLCETCGEVKAVRKERYCAKCRKAKLKEMLEAGYLVRGYRSAPRGLDQREAPSSDPSPWGENAVRAMDGD